MKGYRQFCPVAKAAEIVAERWTPLVLRELLCGSTGFNQLRRGVPLMSPSLLSRRLRELEQAGIVSRTRRGARAWEYRLTPSGRELGPIVEQLGVWGKRWAQAYIEDHDLDAGLLMWDIHRNLHLDRLPLDRTVLEFQFAGAASGKRRWWLVIQNDADVELCLLNPGFDVDLRVQTHLRTLTEIWLGDRELTRAIAEGAMKLEGPAKLVRAFPQWLRFGPLSRVERVA
jgi:DNA-binding HxlR family transcriptional regulator